MAEKKLALRSEVNQAHKWNLSPLFSSDEAWERAYEDARSRIDGFDRYKGRLGESPEVFLEAVEFDLAFGRELDRIATYAHLRNDEDKTNMTYEEMYQKAVMVHTAAAEKSSFMLPEMQALPAPTADAYLSHPKLAAYKIYLERVFRFRPHTRSHEVEELLALSGEIQHAPSAIFSQLDNADLTFGSITGDDGETTELTHGNFSSFLQSKNRDIRKKAFFQYYASYDAHKHTIAASLSASIKKDKIAAKIRRFGSARARSLFGDDVPLSVYDNLISTVRGTINPIVKYLNLRKKILKVDTLHFYDTYTPLVGDVDFNLPYETAVDTITEALAPLGSEYCGILREGLLSGGWVDRYENKGKRSGAYSSGCYDSPPYILTNYRDDNINSLYTLIHEAGHSMHSYYSHKTQPYQYSDYTIFVAEVASTFNETLLSHYLLEKHKNDRSMRAYILNREIDNIRATLHRQTMFAEFEKITHEIVENDNPLTLDTMRSVYRSLLEAYFGGALTIDDELELECLRIPHFYSAFYVYKYSTGVSAAIALADRVLREGSPARDAYQKFLTLGGSAFPIDELKTAGVNMSRPEPIEHALRHFEKLADELEDTLI